jgi:hypothetical protein
MSEYTMLNIVAGHPWLVALAVLLALIVLLVPHDVVRDVHGYRVRALLWTLERSPGYTRLRLPGLLRLQRALLRGVGGIWRQIRGRVLAGVADMLRRWLG